MDHGRKFSKNHREQLCDILRIFEFIYIICLWSFDFFNIVVLLFEWNDDKGPNMDHIVCLSVIFEIKKMLIQWILSKRNTKGRTI
jgi:hypothetical protein